MGSAARLANALETLAALAAYVRVEREGIPVDPQVHGLLRAISVEAAGGDPASIGPAGDPVVGMTRAFLAQSAELIANPGRSGGWTPEDDTLLQGIGRTSAAIGPVMSHVSGRLDGMAEALAAPGAAFLDVGTGCGWLAIALARAFPEARVVGIDIYERALELARGNVAGMGLEGRVELRHEDVLALGDDAAYDAVWLPLPFLPRAVVPGAIAAATRALRPGGWLLPGVFAGPPDPLSQLLCDLRTVRAGGHPWTPADLLAELSTDGLAGAHEVERTWAAPVRLYAARRV